jgi:hypothetical protein
VVSGEIVTGVVPKGLPFGDYNLIVVNPDGHVGLLENAFKMTVAPPPIVANISNFDNPRVTETCRAPGGTETTRSGGAVESAFIFVVGGQSTGGPTATLPSISVTLEAPRSTSSRQRTLMATISLPSGPTPRAYDSMPHVLQNKWWMTCWLNR